MSEPRWPLKISCYGSSYEVHNARERDQLLDWLTRLELDHAHRYALTEGVAPPKPESSVPLSAIQALVQQISETLETCTIYGPADRLRDQVRRLAALCPAPPEDRK